MIEIKVDIDNHLNWMVSPSLWLGSSLDDMGFGYGVSAVKGKFGFEINFNSTVMNEEKENNNDGGWEGRSDNTKSMKYNAFNWLVLYEKNFSNFTTRLGFGHSSIHSEVNNIQELVNSMADTTGSGNSSELFMRASIGKHFNYKNINFTPMFEMNYFNEEVGFSLMTRFDFGM